MPLVLFPDRKNMVFLVNPEHITALTPAISRGPAPVSLHVRIKVLGLSELNLKLGDYENHDDADARWQQLLALLGNAVV